MSMYAKQIKVEGFSTEIEQDCWIRQNGRTNKQQQQQQQKLNN